MIPFPLHAFIWQTSAGTFRGSVQWESTLPLILLIVLALGLGVLMALQWRDLRQRVSLANRWGLCILRSVVYVLVLGMLLNPSLLIQKILVVLPPLAVLLDTSASMALPGSEERSRLQQAKDYLLDAKHSALEALQAHYQVTLYQFDETVRTLPRQQIQESVAQGNSTDLLGALATVLDKHHATSPSGVIVLSDGAHHGSDTGLGYLRQVGIPVVTVGLGDPETYRDIRVAAVQAPTLTFLHYPAEINVTLEAQGYRGDAVAVVLQRAGQVVATTTVSVTEEDFAQQVQFTIEPEDIGEFTYTVSVAPQAGEVVTENNRVDFSLSVVRDKIRVLLVCGSPTWNYRFLRQAFKQDPSIDLVSFVILRTPTDVVNVPENQLSLIPFPTQRLFTQELKNFDLILFENFSFQRYFPWYYLENVRTYVQEGGAFAMVGGPLAFAQGGYAGTPIEDLLPVLLRRDRDDYRPVTQRMQLTVEGKTHPITRLVANDDENQRIWEAMPELDALNIAMQVKPEATVLGVSTENFGDQNTVPLLAMQRFGQGRTLALLTDYIWKWNFQLAGRLDSNQYYLQFIRQMVRWLVNDPVLQQVRVMADASEFPLGSDITGTIQVLQDDYRPAAEAVLRPTIRTPAGVELPVQFAPTDNPGEFRFHFRAETEGLYTLNVPAQVGNTLQEAKDFIIRVQPVGNEKQFAAPNHVLLKDIAERTGGIFFALHDPARPTIDSLAQFLGGKPDFQVLEEKRLYLRTTWPLFLVLLGLLAIEWWWRRQVGLI